MNKLKENWFTEACDMWPGGTFSFQVKQQLHEEQSQFQHIQVFDTVTYGRVLVLDGIIQCTEKDEFSYQEMISFLPLYSHDKPEKVLIVGGGDGGVAREVAKHPAVKEIVQVEIDPRVIEVSKKYLPFMAAGFASDKLTLHVGDGFEFLQRHEASFDVVITDSSDPVGPAEHLFGAAYYELVRRALRPGGVACSQAGAAWNDLPHVARTLAHCRAAFPAAAYAVAAVPTYPSGQIGFVLGSLRPAARLAEPRHELDRAAERRMRLRYYNSAAHRAAFALPTFVRDALESPSSDAAADS